MVIANAVVKVRERSKFVLKEVMGFNAIVYWEFVEPAVLGEMVAEETAKFTWEFMHVRVSARRSNMRVAELVGGIG